MKLSNTPLYSTFLRIELLLESQKPLEALQVLEHELTSYDADAYLRLIRAAYDKQAGMSQSYYYEVEAAWRDYEGALHDVFEPKQDWLEPTPEQLITIKALRRTREGRLQAIWEMHRAADQVLPEIQRIEA